jgi:glycine/D-amino acid oxidase-like deaminating enzyme
MWRPQLPDIISVVPFPSDRLFLTLMKTDTLIIGQGICGSFLAWWLEQADVSFVVIDEAKPSTASKAAAGLINPVTGRRIVKTWMIDELMPFADEAYRRMGQDLGIACIEQTRIVDFFPTAQMRVAFLERLAEDPQYLELPQDQHDWRELFNYDLGYGLVGSCRLIDLPGLLAASRARLRQMGSLVEERFEQAALSVDTGIRYKDILADRIIFCDGVESCDSPYFSRLPFAPNKGEALLVEIPDLQRLPSDSRCVFKKGINLVPWRDGLYWAGSTYEWTFEHAGPTEAFRSRTESILRGWLKIPFKITDHLASVRPATLERRPFVGFHPAYPAIGMLNGMGSKGCSLAPYFAHQLAEYMVNGTAIRADADVRRFSKLLGRR